MWPNAFRRLWVLGLVVALLGWSAVSPRIPVRWRVPAQAGASGLLVLVTRAPLGLRPPRLRAGLRLGSTVGTVAAAGVAITTSLPIVRASIFERELPGSVWCWLGYRIPVGTVWAEEAAFRAALARACSEVVGASGARLIQAVTFGLSHIADARATGEPMVPIVVATGVAGWLFSWLAERCGSLVAPMMVHLAINETAAIAAVVVQRRMLR